MKINLRAKKTIWAICGGLLAWASLCAESRSWTNTDGKKVVGEQVGLDLTKQTLQLKMADGKTYNIPLGGLSKDDVAVAKAWKYPPSLIITYDTKAFGSTVVQALIHVRNNSKSAHNYWVLCMFGPVTKKDSSGAETRVAQFQLQNSTKLDPNESTDKDFANDPEEGFRPPDSPNLPRNRWLVVTNKTLVEDMAVIVISKDDSSFLAIKATNPTLEAYIRKNFKAIMENAPQEPEPDPGA